MNARNLTVEIFDTIAALGFDVYTPTRGPATYLYFTDGTRIGYLQRGDWGGLSLSTVHIPNQRSGTGFRVTDDNEPPLALTRVELERAFAHVPQWADARVRESVRKWPSIAAFLKSNSIVPLRLERATTSEPQTRGAAPTPPRP